MSKFYINGKELILDSKKKVVFDYPIKEAVSVNSEFIIVMLDRETYQQSWGEFKNLFGLNPEGSVLWNLGAPERSNADCFWKIENNQGQLNAYSISSYKCTIDPATGKIIDEEFYK